MTPIQYLAVCAGLSVFVVGCAALGSVFTLWLLERKERPARRPTPRPARHSNPTLTAKAVGHVVRETDPAIVIPAVSVVYQPGQVKAADGDPTEIRTKVADMRVIEESPYARWRRP
jgi:hypothetical protein